MRYEYKLLHVRADLGTASGLPKDINIEFDRLGAEGWEYADMKPLLGGGLFWAGITTRTRGYIVIFRKALE